MTPRRALFDGRRQPVQWLSLATLTVALVGLALWLHLPAALLIGPMIAAILVGTSDGTIRVPAMPFIAAQGVIGCMIGGAIPLAVVAELAKDWPLFLAGIVLVILVTTATGLVMTRARILPGTTAIWGTSPGASTSMILMAEAYGGDIRLVAVMQHLRILCTVLAATIVARLWVGGDATPAPTPEWLPQIAIVPFLATLAVALGGAALATAMRLPAGALLLPIVGMMVLHETAGLEAELPPWLLAASYAVVGWSIGLRFTRAILVHALRALPAIFASIAVLIAACALIAAGFVRFGGIDPLTAYLATSPGGVDSIAIIAAASSVDMRFVMAMQTSRMIVVMVTSPIISRYLAEKMVRLRP